MIYQGACEVSYVLFQIFKEDLIIPDPEFASVNLDPSHEFLILASDGLWDVLSPDDAVLHVT